MSVNRRDWEIVCDKRDQLCRSWQYISFEMRPVVFIRIIGTHNTANEVNFLKSKLKNSIIIIYAIIRYFLPPLFQLKSISYRA